MDSINSHEQAEDVGGDNAGYHSKTRFHKLKEQMHFSLRKMSSMRSVADAVKPHSCGEELDDSLNTRTTAASTVPASVSHYQHLDDSLSDSFLNDDSNMSEREHHSSWSGQATANVVTVSAKLASTSDGFLHTRRRFLHRRYDNQFKDNPYDQDHEGDDTANMMDYEDCGVAEDSMPTADSSASSLDFDSILYGKNVGKSSPERKIISPDGLLRQYPLGASSRGLLILEAPLLEDVSGEEAETTDDDFIAAHEEDSENNNDANSDSNCQDEEAEEETEHCVDDLYEYEGQDDVEESYSPWDDSAVFETGEVTESNVRNFQENEEMMGNHNRSATESEYVIHYGLEESDNGTSWCGSVSTLFEEVIEDGSERNPSESCENHVKCLQLNIMPKRISDEILQQQKQHDPRHKSQSQRIDSDHRREVQKRKEEREQPKSNNKNSNRLVSPRRQERKLTSRDQCFSSALLEDDLDGGGPLFPSSTVSEPYVPISSMNISGEIRSSASASELSMSSNHEKSSSVSLHRHLNRNKPIRSVASGGSSVHSTRSRKTVSRRMLNSSSSSSSTRSVGRVPQRRILTSNGTRTQDFAYEATHREKDELLESSEDNGSQEFLQETSHPHRQVRYIRTSRGASRGISVTASVQHKHHESKTVNERDHSISGVQSTDEHHVSTQTIVPKKRISKSSSHRKTTTSDKDYVAHSSHLQLSSSNSLSATEHNEDSNSSLDIHSFHGRSVNTRLRSVTNLKREVHAKDNEFSKNQQEQNHSCKSSNRSDLQRTLRTVPSLQQPPTSGDYKESGGDNDQTNVVADDSRVGSNIQGRSARERVDFSFNPKDLNDVLAVSSTAGSAAGSSEPKSKLFALNVPKLGLKGILGTSSTRNVIANVGNAEETKNDMVPLSVLQSINAADETGHGKTVNKMSSRHINGF